MKLTYRSTISKRGRKSKRKKTKKNGGSQQLQTTALSQKVSILGKNEPKVRYSTLAPGVKPVKNAILPETMSFLMIVIPKS